MEKQTIQYRLVKRLTSIVAESMTRGLVTIAAIAGLVCGLVEGVVHCFTRESDPFHR